MQTTARMAANLASDGGRCARRAEGPETLDDTRRRHAAKASMSSSSVDHPTTGAATARRRHPSPRAPGEGSRDSDEQDEPEWTATPAWSSPRSTGSASTPSMPRHTMWGTRSDGVAVGEDAVDRGGDGKAAGRSAAGRLPPPRRGGPATASAAAAGAEPDGARDVLQTRPPAPLLLAADQERVDPESTAQDERPDPGGPAQFVGRDRHQVGAERLEVERARGRRRPPRRRGRGYPARGSRATTPATSWTVPTSWLADWQCTSAGGRPCSAEERATASADRRPA